MAELSGAQVVARSLKQQGVNELFGLVGLPVTAIAAAAQEADIRYIGTRHEQAAGYAAQATSYLTGRIGACIAVSGPGMTNVITALGNAQANCWPMLLIGGAANQSLALRGDFQDAPQVAAARPFVKWAEQVPSVAQIPQFLASAVRGAISGRPGPVYLDMPGDIISGKIDESEVRWQPRVPDPPRPRADDASLAAALAAIKSAENPLVIVGKGAAWARAEAETREFIDRTQLPYLPTPMGKGVIPDDHPLSTAAARSFALQNADLVFLIGARLNWILHFGLPPRFREGVRVVQLDIAGEEIGTNVPTEVALVGDAKAVMGQLNAALDQDPWQLREDNEWKAALRAEADRKRADTVPLLTADDVPMNYYRPLQEIQDALPRDAILVTEGASTMDISRQVIDNYNPRTRLDAGSWGTMGVGPGFALAAQALNPGRRVVALEGDSAFGFGAAEVETAVRNGLPITWIVFNNNGIGGGLALDELPEGSPIPPNTFVPGAHYERIIEAFGGKGYHCETPDELRSALKDAMAQEGSTLINVTISPTAGRRSQEFGWLTR